MAFRRVILDSANRERSAIVEHLVKSTGSTTAASGFLDDLDRAVDLASEFPTMYALSRFPQLAEKGYRTAVMGNYVMLYRFENETVFVAHVFHQRQDYAKLV